jgi:hypothetical protein
VIGSCKESMYCSQLTRKQFLSDVSLFVKSGLNLPSFVTEIVPLSSCKIEPSIKGLTKLRVMLDSKFKNVAKS